MVFALWATVELFVVMEDLLRLELLQEWLFF